MANDPTKEHLDKLRDTAETVRDVLRTVRGEIGKERDNALQGRALIRLQELRGNLKDLLDINRGYKTMDEHQLTQFLTRFKRFNHALSAFANDYYTESQNLSRARRQAILAGDNSLAPLMDTIVAREYYTRRAEIQLAADIADMTYSPMLPSSGFHGGYSSQPQNQNSGAIHAPQHTQSLPSQFRQVGTIQGPYNNNMNQFPAPQGHFPTVHNPVGSSTMYQLSGGQYGHMYPAGSFDASQYQTPSYVYPQQPAQPQAGPSGTNHYYGNTSPQGYNIPHAGQQSPSAQYPMAYQEESPESRLYSPTYYYPKRF